MSRGFVGALQWTPDTRDDCSQENINEQNVDILYDPAGFLDTFGRFRERLGRSVTQLTF
jgi:hypothetical protein